MVSKDNKLSVRRQCALLTLARSNLYYEPKGESRRTCGLWRSSIARQAHGMAMLPRGDKQFLETPWYGSRQMARHMKRNNHACGRHRVRRLMRLMRLVPIYQEPNTRRPATHACMCERGQETPQHKIWPYLLRYVVIDRPNQVWCADYYIPPLGRFALQIACRAMDASRLPVSRGDHGLV